MTERVVSLTFKDAFTSCLVEGGRYRNSCCPHNDGEPSVWYRAVRGEDGWPDHGVYAECGTAVSVTDFVALLDSMDATWEVERQG
jgi:hypothetical protein